MLIVIITEIKTIQYKGMLRYFVHYGTSSETLGWEILSLCVHHLLASLRS